MNIEHTEYDSGVVQQIRYQIAHHRRWIEILEQELFFLGERQGKQDRKEEVDTWGDQLEED